MIRINCFYQAKEGQYAHGLEAAIALVAKSQKHEGVVAYDVFESATRPDVFCIVETWQNQEVLDKHSATPEFIQYVGIMQETGELKIETFEF
ncbi:MAG: antibiotic biosynthesis monooxygenase [Bacteroidaceae bacterium]|nr:antibiotic biosynthesis monooxygenase [Bacteroidaceae bacterium]